PTADSHIIFFCFEAEDGIRDFHVTGVQTCALPISGSPRRPAPLAAGPVPPVLGSAARRFRSRCVIVRYGRPLKVRQSLMTDIHSAPASSSAAAPVVLDVTGTDIPGEAIALRERGPLVRVVLPGDIRAWAVTDPEVLKQLFTDWRVSKDAHRHWPAFRSGEVPPDWPLITWVSVRNMFTAYGKDHQRLRKLVGPAFTARRVSALRPQIKMIIRRLLDDLAARPDGAVIDLREDYATQVPLRVISALMGVPTDLQPRLRVCVDEIFSTTPQRDPQATFIELISLLTTL